MESTLSVVVDVARLNYHQWCPVRTETLLPSRSVNQLSLVNFAKRLWFSPIQFLLWTEAEKRDSVHLLKVLNLKIIVTFCMELIWIFLTNSTRCYTRRSLRLDDGFYHRTHHHRLAGSSSRRSGGVVLAYGIQKTTQDWRSSASSGRVPQSALYHSRAAYGTFPRLSVVEKSTKIVFFRFLNASVSMSLIS